MHDLDVAIIGAGPAGLSAAYALRGAGLDVRIFEREPEVGGRMRSRSLAGAVVNPGAMFVYTGTETDKLCDELEIDTFPVTPSTFGVHVDGRTVVARDDETLLHDLNLPGPATSQLARVLGDVRDVYANYMAADSSKRDGDRLASVSFAEYLGELDPAVNRVVRTAVLGGSCATADELSAEYAMRYFASYLVRDPNQRRYAPSGMQSICEALHRRLGAEVVSLGTEVRHVAATLHERYELALRDEAGRVGTVRADHVIFATPGPVVGSLAPWLPAAKLEAIRRVPTNPSVTLAVVVDKAGSTDLDDIYFIATPDSPYNMILQPQVGPHWDQDRTQHTYFTCNLSADAAAAEPGDDEAMTQEWLEDFLRVVPAARDRVLGTLLTRWRHCFAYVRADRSEVLSDVRSQVAGVHFAGDYTSETAGSHGAFVEGARTAREVLLQLSHAPSEARPPAG
jgi:protoporphyrinogen oxidase